MNSYFLQVNSNIVGGYFSSEQIDLLSIIQCNTSEELIDFVDNCEQIKGIYKNYDLAKIIDNLGIENAKRRIFRDFQNTMVTHDASKELAFVNMLEHCGIKMEDMEEIKKSAMQPLSEKMEWLKKYIESNYPDRYDEIFFMSHSFVSTERDQNKSEDLYDELSVLNDNIANFDSMLLGSGKIYNVVNILYEEYELSKRYDFYHMKRDLDFALKNGKQVRYHSLLVKEDMDYLFNGKSKEEIKKIIKDYVKQSIDFISKYNDSHRDTEKVPVINAVDLFNEIVSFDKNENGEYYNIWEEKYGITIKDLTEIFDYAKMHKPEGVSYLYNEPFLEDDERRKKVFEVLSEIDMESPDLIDTLGSQMHITITEDVSKIKRCFEDFKKLQSKTDKKIQITEFDMSLGRSDAPRIFGENPDVTLEQAYQVKEQKIIEISNIINSSGVELSGISYWSLTDGIDCNLERIRTNELCKNNTSKRMEIPTACGGLYPTHKKLIQKEELSLVNETKMKIIDKQQNIEVSHKYR